MSTQFYTYIYRDPVRQMEPFYVGKGLKYRIKMKKNKSVENRRQNILDAGGITFIEVIHALDEDHSKFLEICLIDIFGRRDLGTGTLWNFTTGGDGTSGYKHTDKSKDKIRNTHTGSKRSVQTRQNISNSLKGVPKPPMTEEHRAKLKGPITDEHKEKLSLAKLNKRLSDKHKESMRKPKSEEARKNMAKAQTLRFSKKRIEDGNDVK